MKRLSFLALALLLAATAYAANEKVMQARNYEWANDPRSLGFSTKGLEEFLPESPEGNATAFGDVVGQWTWSSIGIPGYYAGAGIALDMDNDWMYLQNQYYYRTYIISISTGVPVSQTWFYSFGYQLPWGAGIDNEPEFWSGDVYYSYSWNDECTMYPPTPTLTGNSFNAYQGYSWMADISDNYNDDLLFQLRVGNDNNIYEFTEPGGSVNRNFGDPLWNWISQRALAYNNDNNTFFLGGWNVNTIYEVNTIDGGGIPGRNFGSPSPAGATYQDEANGGPYVWVQSNEFYDRLTCYESPKLLADDIGVQMITAPDFPFIGPDPFAVSADIANLGTADQDFDTWVEIDDGTTVWTSTVISTSLGSFASANYTYETFPNGRDVGTEFDVCVKVDNPGDEDTSNDELCGQYKILRQCIPYATDDGTIANAFYFYGYNYICAKRMNVGPTDPATLVWMGVNTVSAGEPFYPWPDPVYDPIMISAWTDDDLNGSPENTPAYEVEVTPTDMPWVTVEVPPCSFLGMGGTVWVGFQNKSPGREGLCTDNVREHFDTYYFYGTNWYMYTGYGDWHIRGCLEFPPLITIEGLEDVVYECPEPWVQVDFMKVDFRAVLCGKVEGSLSATNLLHEYLPKKIEGSMISFDPPAFAGEGGETIDMSMIVQIPIGQHKGVYSGTVVITHTGGVEQIPFSLTVTVCSDLDVQDYAGNLVANTMITRGIREGIAVGTFTAVNPNCVDNNVDLYDGPGNGPLYDLTWEATDLRICGKGAKCKGVTMVEFMNNGPDAYIEVISKGTTYFSGMVASGATFSADAAPNKFGSETEIWVDGVLAEKVHTSCSKPIYVGMAWGDFELVDMNKLYDTKYAIPAACVNVIVPPVLPSGEGFMGIVEIAIPKDAKHWKHDYDYAYCGMITVSGMDQDGEWVSDAFKVRLMVLKGKDGGDPCGFWGEVGAASNELHWSDFGLGEEGYAIYRNEVKLADLPSGEHDYIDPVASNSAYEYELGVKVGGSEIMIGPIVVGGTRVPTVFSLSQNYPNPVGDNTSIRYTVGNASNVTIGVYNSAGMLVSTLVNEHKTPGIYTVSWDNVDLSNGVYFYRMNANDFSMTRKMVVLR
jgi:hypothetical protein